MGRFVALAFVVSLAGCGDDPPPVPIGAAAVTVPVADAVPDILPVLQAPVDLLPAADIELEGFEQWPLRFPARFHQTLECAIAIERGGEIVRALDATRTADTCEASWDGRGDGGARLDPGVVRAVATLSDDSGERARAEATLEIVRLGIGRIQLVSEGRVPLLWRKMGGELYGYYVAGAGMAPWRIGPDDGDGAAAVTLELADGSPRPLPEIWDDLLSPPLDPGAADGVEDDVRNLPTAFVAGSQIEVVARLVTGVAGAPASGAPALHEVRVVPPEGTALEGDPAFVANGDVTVVATDRVPAVGRYDLELRWRFEARAAGGDWTPMPGGIVTRHRLYGLAGFPVFDYDDVPHRAWVDVVDQVAEWVEGATADPELVAARIVEGVYYELGLVYDSERGASFYSSYPRGSWTGASFNATRFMERDNGSVVNCSDAAAIVSSFSNMVGVDLRYHILTHQWERGFDLYYLQAIGSDSFAASPFRSGNPAFSYHAVTGPPDGSFFDATLALDGDGMPWAAPHEVLLAEGLPAMDYLSALSPEAEQIRIQVDEKVRVR